MARAGKPSLFDTVISVSRWRRGDVRYSYVVRLRNNSEGEEQLHRFRAEFRKGNQPLFTDSHVLQDKPVILPSKKWVSLEIRHGMHNRSVIEEADSVWLVAEMVGDKVLFEWLLAKLALKIEELEEA